MSLAPNMVFWLVEIAGLHQFFVAKKEKRKEEIEEKNIFSITRIFTFFWIKLGNTVCKGVKLFYRLFCPFELVDTSRAFLLSRKVF